MQTPATKQDIKAPPLLSTAKLILEQPQGKYLVILSKNIYDAKRFSIPYTASNVVS